METNITIGSMIEDEVRKQQIDVADFARRINTVRNNVYNIFKRNSINIELLQRISKALNHNFFEDLSKDYSLALPPKLSEKEINRLQAINNFLEYVPNALERLGEEASIIIAPKYGFDENVPVPDFFLTKFNITFTIGQTYEQKCNGFWDSNQMMFEKVSENSPAEMVGYMRVDDGIQSLDIAIDHKSEEEWFDTIQFALEEIKTMYLPLTWNYLNNEQL